MATDNQARKILILLILALARIKRKEVIKSPIVSIEFDFTKALHACCGVHAWMGQGWLECGYPSAPATNFPADSLQALGVARRPHGRRWLCFRMGSSLASGPTRPRARAFSNSVPREGPPNGVRPRKAPRAPRPRHAVSRLGRAARACARARPQGSCWSGCRIRPRSRLPLGPCRKAIPVDARSCPGSCPARLTVCCEENPPLMVSPWSCKLACQD